MNVSVNDIVRDLSGAKLGKVYAINHGIAYCAGPNGAFIFNPQIMKVSWF